MKSATEFRANGKLLLTGEYLVLAGAKALAFPVRFGQQMVIRETALQRIDWESATPSGSWFTASFAPDNLNIISTDQTKIATELIKLLAAARCLNPDFAGGQAGWKVSVNANYPLEWGLGSSSTLCSLVAGWAGVNVFDLFRMVSRGSGYDVACASRSELLFYRLREGRPEITAAEPGKALRENTWFVFLGSKQDSAGEVARFLAGHHYSDKDVEEISQLSVSICDAVSPHELIRLVGEHELLLGTILGRETIASRFPSFPGTVKSLGAWGGDFAMFVSEMEPAEVVTHLQRLGFSSVFSFNDLKIPS